MIMVLQISDLSIRLPYISYLLDAGKLIVEPVESYLLEDVQVQDLFNEFEKLIHGKFVVNRWFQINIRKLCKITPQC